MFLLVRRWIQQSPETIQDSGVLIGVFKSDRGALSVKDEREMLSTTCSSSESSYLLS